MDSLKEKTQKAIELYENLTSSVNTSREYKDREFCEEIAKPSFI
jgi:hypothetical protein